MSNARDIIWDAVHAASGLPADRVIWQQENIPTPKKPFVTLLLINITRVGYEESKVDENNFIITEDVEANLSLNVYGDEAEYLLESIKFFLKSPKARYDLLDGLTIFSMDTITNASSVFKDQFEKRAALEARMGWREKKILDMTDIEESGVTWIETVELNGENITRDTSITEDNVTNFDDW